MYFVNAFPNTLAILGAYLAPVAPNLSIPDKGRPPGTGATSAANAAVFKAVAQGFSFTYSTL